MKYLNKYKTYQYSTKTQRFLKFRRKLRDIAYKTVLYLYKAKMDTLGGLLYRAVLPKPMKEFHINDKYIVIDGEFEGKRFGEAIKKCTSLCMLYIEDQLDRDGNKILITPKGEHNDASYQIGKWDFEIIK